MAPKKEIPQSTRTLRAKTTSPGFYTDSAMQQRAQAAVKDQTTALKTTAAKKRGPVVKIKVSIEKTPATRKQYTDTNKKKPATKKKAAAEEKVAVEKKPAPKKKLDAEKKPATKKKAAAEKKPAVKSGRVTKPKSESKFKPKSKSKSASKEKNNNTPLESGPRDTDSPKGPVSVEKTRELYE